MHWNKMVIGLRAARTLQVFDLGTKEKLKSHAMPEDVVFWKWITETKLGLVTDTSVYHWDVFDGTANPPVKVFDRNANLSVSTPRAAQEQKRELILTWFRTAKSSTTALTPTRSGWFWWESHNRHKARLGES